MSNLLENVDSITRPIMSIGAVTIEHRIVIFNRDSKNFKNKPYSTKLFSSRTKGGICGLPSYYFRDTKDYIILKNTKSEFGDNKNRASVCFSYRDSCDVKKAFEESISWFEKEPIKNELFVYDHINRPTRILQKYENVNTVINLKTGLKGSFMSIQPCIITDFSTQTVYPGVVIKGLTGVIGCLTYDELKLCATTIINNLNTLYLNSLTLMNHFLLSEANSTGGNKV